MNDNDLMVMSSEKRSPTQMKISPKSSFKSPRALSSDKFIQIPPLEQKFRFVIPTNCHVSKSIMAALNHSSKIVETASKKDVDGEVSIEFGLHMNDGPIEDTQRARDFGQVSPTGNAEKHQHRHADCKTGVSEDFWQGKMLALWPLDSASTDNKLNVDA